MSTLSPREQELFDLALASLPDWYRGDGTDPQSTIAGFAKLFGMAWAQADTWVDNVYIKKAVGVWLDAHARDRGTRRQNGESDAALAARLAVPTDAVTLPALRDIANAILASNGVSGSVTIVEGRNGSGAYYQANGSSLQAFWGMGYRWDGHPHDIYVLVPAAASAATLAAIEEAMRLFAAGGVDVFVEQANPADSGQLIVLTPPANATSASAGTAVIITAHLRVPDTVTWAVNGVAGGNSTFGTVSGGVYHPPAAPPVPEDVEVQAVSTLDSTVIGRARVKVNP